MSLGDAPVAVEELVVHNPDAVHAGLTPTAMVHGTELDDGLQACVGRPFRAQRQSLLRKISASVATHNILPVGIGDKSAYDIRYLLALSAVDSLGLLEFDAQSKDQPHDMLVNALSMLTMKAIETPGFPEALHTCRRSRMQFDFSEMVSVIIVGLQELGVGSCKGSPSRLGSIGSHGHGFDEQGEQGALRSTCSATPATEQVRDHLGFEVAPGRSDSEGSVRDTAEMTDKELHVAHSCRLEPGAIVKTIGLQVRTELNGKVGIVEAYIPHTARWRVSLDEHPSDICLKAANLVVLSEEELDYYFNEDIDEQ